MCKPSHRPGRLVAALAVCGLVGTFGCASPQPQPPPVPQGPRTLTIYPEHNQSKAQQSSDQAQCQNTASAQAVSSQTWIQIFTACMSGRGYGVR